MNGCLPDIRSKIEIVQLAEVMQIVFGYADETPFSFALDLACTIAIACKQIS